MIADDAVAGATAPGTATRGSPPATPGGAAPRAWVRTLAVLGVTVLFSVCYVAIKAGLAYTPPLFFGGVRALIAGAVILALAAGLGVPVLPRRRWRGTLLLALTGTTLTFGGMFLSVAWSTPGIAAVLGNIQPLIAVLLAAVLLAEPVDRTKALALALGALGVVLVAYAGLRGGPRLTGLGDAMALSASLGSALASVIVKKMDLRVDLLAVSGWQLVLGSLPLLAAGAAVEPVASITWGAPFAAILLFLSLAGTALTTVTWFWLLRYDEVGRLSLFLFLTPVLGLGLGAITFGEPIGPVEAAGALLIVGGILAVVRGSARA